MYAIIRSGGKQAKVRPGDVVQVELLSSESEEVSFRPLLVVDDDGTAIADPARLTGAAVNARILGTTKGPKIDIFTYKSKTGSRRRMGHRQKYTTLEVTSIDLGSREA